MKAFLLLFTLIFQSIILHAQDQQKLLEHAYKTKSKTELKQFFDNWHKEIPPISDSEFVKLSDLQKQTYNVFAEYFKEDNYSYKRYKYVVLPDRIAYGVTKQDLTTFCDSASLIIKGYNRFKDKTFGNKTPMVEVPLLDSIINLTLLVQNNKIPEGEVTLLDSIINFRPLVQNNKIPVYLTLMYDSLLDNFAGFGTGDFGTVVNNNVNFLSKIISITSTPIPGESWVFYSLPEVYSIKFDKTLNAAILESSTFRRGVMALLKKESGHWKTVKFAFTWFE